MQANTYKLLPWVALIVLWVTPACAKDLEAATKAVDGKIIAWRRDFHQHPELSNREVRTSGIVAAHLKSPIPHSSWRPI